MTAPANQIDVRAAVHEAIAAILPGLSIDDIDGSRHLKELGADSIDRVEIIMHVLDRCLVSAPMSRFSDIPDIDHLIAVVDELRMGASS